MAEQISNVERGLWRIAELGARCSQQSAAGGRGPLWAELEQTIAGLEADFEAARQAVDIAPSQVRSLEGRLNVAQKERDRERARAVECFADAESARRERDRERARAAKAKTDADAARAVADDCIARATAVQAALDQAVSARDEVTGVLNETEGARDRAMTALEETKTALEETATARDRAMSGLNKAKADLNKARIALDEAKTALDEAKADRTEAMAALDEAKAGRTEAMAALDEAKAGRTEVTADLDDAKSRIAVLEADLEAVRADRDAVVAAQAAATAGRVDALDTLAALAEGAVVVLPGVNLPDAEVGPIAPARVSWRPTWSEWAGDSDSDDAGTGRDAGASQAAPVPTAVDDLSGAAGEIVLDAAEEGGVRRYLNVAATIGQLLPEDLGPLLLSGATVIRREGRLFATVAVTANPWAESGSDGAEQVQKLSDAGFRVEWTSTAPMAC